jgi:hypothetical protein
MFPAQRTFGREDIFEQAPSTGTLIPEAHHTGLNYVPCNLLAVQEAASDAENTHTHTHTHTHTSTGEKLPQAQDPSSTVVRYLRPTAIASTPRAWLPSVHCSQHPTGATTQEVKGQFGNSASYY